MTSSHWRRCISALGHEGGILYVLAEVLSREVDDMDIWSTQWVSEKTLVILCIPPLRNYLSCHNQFSSVAQFCLTFCNPMDCSTPGFPVHHQFPELAQTHVHQVGDAIQPSHPLSPPSPPAFNLFQNQGLFQWVSSLHHVAKRTRALASTLSLLMNI